MVLLATAGRGRRHQHYHRQHDARSVAIVRNCRAYVRQKNEGARGRCEVVDAELAVLTTTTRSLSFSLAVVVDLYARTYSTFAKIAARARARRIMLRMNVLKRFT